MASRKKVTAGTAFENEVKNVCDAYAKAGKAFIRKCDPPTRTIRIGGIPKTIQLENPFLDFVGTLPGGRMIMIEAKSTEEPLLCLRDEGTRGGGVSFNQLTYAREWEDSGACVCFLWKHNNEVKFLTVAMLEAEKLGRKSIRWESAHRLYPSVGFITFDFLAAIRAVYQIATPSNPHATA